MAAVASAGLLLILAAGCAAASPPDPPSATPTPTPVFASDEEALAAAEEAYANYLRVSDEILMDGGADPERIIEFTSAEMANSEIDGYLEAKEQRFHSTGGSTFANLTIQSVSSGFELEGAVMAYVCSDVSLVDVVNEKGESIVPDSRPDRTPFEITFDLAEPSSKRLVVARAEVWSGGGVCV
jgi:hypothetical protein